MKPEDLITYGLIIGAVGFGLRLISWSVIGIIDYLQHPIVVKAGNSVVTETVAVFNSADFNSVMLKPFLYQIDYIGACLFYGSLLTISGVLIFAIATKTKLDFTEKLVEGQDVSEILLNGNIITPLHNCVFPIYDRKLSRVEIKDWWDAAHIIRDSIGNSESRYSEALMYMRDYFPTNPVTATYLKCKLRLMSRNYEDYVKSRPQNFSMDSEKFVYNTIMEYISRQDPTLTRELIVHAGSALMEFAVWLTSSGTIPPL